MFDANMIFSEGQSLISEEATLVSTNIVDLGTGLNGGDDGDNILEVWIKTTQVGASTTLQIVLMDCDTVGGSYRTVLASRAFELADVAASKERPFLSFSIPGGVQGVRRFTQMNYIVGGGHITAGAITAGIRARGV